MYVELPLPPSCTPVYNPPAEQAVSLQLDPAVLKAMVRQVSASHTFASLYSVMGQPLPSVHAFMLRVG